MSTRDQLREIILAAGWEDYFLDGVFIRTGGLCKKYTLTLPELTIYKDARWGTVKELRPWILEQGLFSEQDLVAIRLLGYDV